MRWNGGKSGDTRIKKGFLFVPRCANFQWRWLERAVWKEEYLFSYWHTAKWIDKETV